MKSKKKKNETILKIVIQSFGVTSIPIGVSVTSIINNYLKSIGGKQNISKVFSIRREGKIQVQGAILELEVIQNNNFQYKSTIKSNGKVLQKTIINKDKGFLEQQGVIKIMDDKTLKKNLMVIHPFPFLEQKYDLMKLEGVFDVNGIECFKINTIDSRSYFFSLDSNLLIKSTIKDNNNYTIESYFSDYKNVDGLLVDITK